jgi:hypothetical protein
VARRTALRHTCGVAGVYRLDDLGWFQFQRLCETILAALGLDGLAFDGAADHCRSAVVAGVPEIPELGTRLDAPVLVAIAWSPPAEEPRRSEDLAAAFRFAALECAVAGRKPRTIVALTNHPLPQPARTELETQLAADPDCDLRPIVLASERLSELLDARPDVRRAAPSVLGLCDLAERVEPGILARSTGDVESARLLARVFVPTTAYARALDVLGRHHFAVLSGPPEMGKTAIARMIGLELLTEGWEFHECIRPDELWRAFDRERRQLFVADDAFGSTEYRPEAAERWALELDLVLRALDDRHRLIWTSRPAPLKAGLRRIHREHGVERWPQPAEIEVVASDLDDEEKALILFRHAKAAELPPGAVRVVKERGVAIVVHEHFTPERIRRFVSDRLPALGEEPELTERAVLDEIREPTAAMTASLLSLEPAYRALLVALLDVPPGPVPERELSAAARRHADSGLPRAPHELVDRLTDHFLRPVPVESVTWVHPSWRDLVIDELAADREARQEFLSRCSIDGVLLAISTAGGAAGARDLPLLREDTDWDTLADRLALLLPELDDMDVARLLNSLETAVRSTRPSKSFYDPALELGVLARYVLERLARAWGQKRTAIPLGLLDGWFALARSIVSPPDPPDLARTWADLAPSDHVDIRSRRSVVRFDDWLRLVTILVYRNRRALAELHDGEQDEVVAAFAYEVATALEAGESLDTIPLLAQCIDRIRGLRHLGWYSVAANRAWHALRTESPPEPEDVAPAAQRLRAAPLVGFVAKILADL